METEKTIKRNNLFLIYANIFLTAVVTIEAILNSIVQYGGELWKILDTRGMLFNNNEAIIILIMEGLAIIFNIVAAIQNRKNKNISSSFGLFSSFFIINYIVSFIRMEDDELGQFITGCIFGIVPIILSIIKIIFCFAKKEKKTFLLGLMLVIAYGVIITIIPSFRFGLLIILCIIQLFYINKKEIITGNSKIKNIINLILYGIIYLPMSILSIIIVSFGIVQHITVYQESNNFIKNIEQEIASKWESNNQQERPCILVSKDEKWGYINDHGENIIECTYDCATHFYQVTINDKTYTVACVKKQDNNYYLLSKKGENILLGEKIAPWTKILENSDNLKTLTIHDFYELLELIQTKNADKKVKLDVITEDKENTIMFAKQQNNKYSYIAKGVSAILEEKGYDSENMYNLYELEIQNNNGERTKNIEYLPLNYREDDYILFNKYTDGYLPFCNINEQIQGWYDNEGKRIYTSGKVEILDVKNEIISFRNYETENSQLPEYFFLKNGQISEVKKIFLLNNGYLVEDKNGKIQYLDNYLKPKGKQYDEIDIYEKEDTKTPVMSHIYEYYYNS